VPHAHGLFEVSQISVDFELAYLSRSSIIERSNFSTEKTDRYLTGLRRIGTGKALPRKRSRGPTVLPAFLPVNTGALRCMGSFRYKLLFFKRISV